MLCPLLCVSARRDRFWNAFFIAGIFAVEGIAIFYGPVMKIQGWYRTLARKRQEQRKALRMEIEMQELEAVRVHMCMYSCVAYTCANCVYLV